MHSNNTHNLNVSLISPMASARRLQQWTRLKLIKFSYHNGPENVLLLEDTDFKKTLNSNYLLIKHIGHIKIFIECKIQ